MLCSDSWGAIRGVRDLSITFRCIDKVTMEEVTEWDTVVQCDHSYNRRCAKSMKTYQIS